jgi:uncharacterized protein involved in exopolysaccharide biosynthesis
MNTHTSELGMLHAYWTLLLRRRSTVAAVFAVTTLVVLVGALFSSPTYAAKGSLMVKFGREFVYRPELGDDGQPRKTFKLEEMVNSEVEILRSRDVAERVVRQMGPAALYPRLADEGDDEAGMARAVAAFQEAVSVTDVLESGIIKVTFEHRDRQVAAAALNLLMAKFMDKHVEVFSDARSSFLGSQLEQYRTELTTARESLAAFKHRAGVHDLLRQKALTLEHRGELDSDLRNIELRRAELERQLVLLGAGAGAEAGAAQGAPPVHDLRLLESRRNELAAVLEESALRVAEIEGRLAQLDQRSRSVATVPAQPGGDDRSLDEATLRLLDLRLQERTLMRDYSEESRQVQGVRQEIRMVEDFLRERGRHVESVLESGLRDELIVATARRDTALEQLSRLDGEIRAVSIALARQELAPLQARRAKVLEHLAALDGQLRDLDRFEKELSDLEQRVATAQRSCEIYADRFEEARITEELDRERLLSVRVIEEAAPPLEAAGLSRKGRLALGMVVGLMSGVAAAIFLELIGQG